MKVCSKCKSTKALDEFYKSNKDGVQSYCKVCAKQAVKISQSNDEFHYEKLKRCNKERLDRAKSQIKVFKKDKGCCFCPEKEPICLDFHHVSDKDESIYYLLNTKSFKRLVSEVEKCILVCSNCHRKIHGGIISIDGQSLIRKEDFLNYFNC